jgi:hypothetical protein
MFHTRRIVILAQRCLPKPEPVHTRPSRGHKTDLRLEKREKVIKVRWREETRISSLAVNNLELFHPITL